LEEAFLQIFYSSGLRVDVGIVAALDSFFPLAVLSVLSVLEQNSQDSDEAAIVVSRFLAAGLDN